MNGAQIDASVLDELLAAVGPAPIKHLLELYLRDAPKLREELEGALRSGDLTTAVRVAHTLKSTSAALGAKAFADQCGQLEALAELEGMKALQRALWTSLDGVLQAFSARAASLAQR